MEKKKRLFCEINPTTYYISLQKEKLKRYLKNLIGNEHYAKELVTDSKMPVVISSHEGDMIKRGPGIDPVLQANKADNIRLACSKINGIIIKPGETFSFWRQVGKTSKRNGFADGRILVNGKLVAGVGGGLCNLANTINLLILHSPMTITELHHHSDALAPDPNNVHVPYSAGTSVNYNFIDYRFRNDTQQPVQLCTWCEGDNLHAELRTTVPYPTTYRLTEDDHHFHKEDNGKYYRISKIYRETIDRESGKVIDRQLNWDNHSEVMFDYNLIPKEQIR
ncbi:MAG: VanW family protein [Bacteroidales bacterium]|nr:VanW family protein [Bacteroidales bacterium]